MAPITRRRALPLNDMKVNNLKKMVTEKLPFKDQLAFSLISKSTSELTDGGNDMKTEVELSAYGRNFDEWQMRDFVDCEIIRIPCSKIAEYPNLRVADVSVDLTFYRNDEDQQLVLSPIQRAWLNDVLVRISPSTGRSFMFEWKEGLNESQNSDIIRQFLEKQPTNVDGAFPPSILFPEWDPTSIGLHEAKLWESLRKHERVHLTVNDEVVNSFMTHLETEYLNGVDTGATFCVTISGKRDSLEWEPPLTDGALKTTIFQYRSEIPRKCEYPDLCGFHDAHDFNLPVWVFAYKCKNGRTAAIVKNLGWDDFCGFFYAFYPDYDQFVDHWTFWNERK